MERYKKIQLKNTAVFSQLHSKLKNSKIKKNLDKRPIVLFLSRKDEGEKIVVLLEKDFEKLTDFFCDLGLEDIDSNLDDFFRDLNLK